MIGLLPEQMAATYIDAEEGLPALARAKATAEQEAAAWRSLARDHQASASALEARAAGEYPNRRRVLLGQAAGHKRQAEQAEAEAFEADAKAAALAAALAGAALLGMG